MQKIHLPVYLALYFFVLLFHSCAEKPEPGTKEFIKKVRAAINDKTLLDVDKDSADWLSYGRNYSEDRYSPLVHHVREIHQMIVLNSFSKNTD